MVKSFGCSSRGLEFWLPAFLSGISQPLLIPAAGYPTPSSGFWTLPVCTHSYTPIDIQKSKQTNNKQTKPRKEIKRNNFKRKREIPLDPSMNTDVEQRSQDEEPVFTDTGNAFRPREQCLKQSLGLGKGTGMEQAHLPLAQLSGLSLPQTLGKPMWFPQASGPMVTEADDGIHHIWPQRKVQN